MPDSLHKKINDNVVSTFEGITVANGYLTDLGSNVYFRTPHPIISDDVVGCNIQDGDVDFGNGTLSGTMHNLCTLDYDVDIFTSGDSRDADMDKAIQDCISALGVDPTRGQTSTNTYMVRYRIQPDTGEETILNCLFQFRVEFFLSRFNALG